MEYTARTYPVGRTIACRVALHERWVAVVHPLCQGCWRRLRPGRAFTTEYSSAPKFVDKEEGDWHVVVLRGPRVEGICQGTGCGVADDINCAHHGAKPQDGGESEDCFGHEHRGNGGLLLDVMGLRAV